MESPAREVYASATAISRGGAEVGAKLIVGMGVGGMVGAGDSWVVGGRVGAKVGASFSYASSDVGMLEESSGMKMSSFEKAHMLTPRSGGSGVRGGQRHQRHSELTKDNGHDEQIGHHLGDGGVVRRGLAEEPEEEPLVGHEGEGEREEAQQVEGGDPAGIEQAHLGVEELLAVSQ